MQAVNTERVLQDLESPAVVRLAAYQARNATGYMQIGPWLQQLHRDDLTYLLKLVDEVQGVEENGDCPAVGTLLLLALVLAQSEGVESDDPATMRDQINQLGFFLITESLARKGLVQVIYKNISFDPATDHLPIVISLSGETDE